MNRKTEIEKAADQYAVPNTYSWNGFMAGAQWSDKTMIEKVCKWLQDQSCCGYIEDVSVDEFINKFRKAMEE